MDVDVNEICETESSKCLSHYVGTCIFRSPNGDKEGQEDIQQVQERLAAGRFCHVSIQYLFTALCQYGKCRSTQETGKKDTARKGAYRHNDHYRQTIWHDGNISGHKTSHHRRHSTTTRAFLAPSPPPFLQNRIHENALAALSNKGI